jgi:glycosyltransferase involved in cell wall biosynthesis
MDNTEHSRGRLVWVYPDSLAERLDTATWLDTTRELQRLGWRVTLLAMGPAGTNTYRGVDAECLPKREIYLLGQALFHFDVIRFLLGRWQDIDIIYFTQLSGFWLLPLRILRFIQRRRLPLLVMDTRDLNDFVPGNLKLRLRIWFQRFTAWMASWLADGQTAITPRMADLVHIPPKQLLGVWPSGVSPRPFAEAARERKWPDPETNEAVQLIYIGMLLPKRNPVPLCQAVRRANHTGLNFQLSFYGSGPAQTEVEQCAIASEGVVRVLPPVAHEQIPALLAQAHVGVTSLPEPDDRKYQASSPIKLFEYMASGLPVLATRNVCHEEVVSDGNYVFWAESADEEAILEALRVVWAKREDLAALGGRAATDAQEWTWEAAAAKIDRALSTALTWQGAMDVATA